MEGNQLKCAPWSNYGNKIKNKNKLKLTVATEEFSINKLEIMLQQNQDITQNKEITDWIQKQISSRAIVVGAPASGKTTFIQLTKDRSKFPTNIATDGIVIANINNITYWDFGGQEVLFSTHKFFLVDRCQYILVVDLSLFIHDDIKKRNECLKYTDYWMKEIRAFNYSPYSPPLIIIGTHCDIINKVKIKQAKEKLLEQAKTNQLLNCCFFKFFKFSSKKDYVNTISPIEKEIQLNFSINKAFALSDNNKDNCTHLLQFLILKQKIEAQKEKKPFMWRNEFEKSFFNDESQLFIDKYTKLLKISGIIETYRFESSAASEIIILDPKYLSNAFTSIVSIELCSSSNRRGFFTLSQIEENLKTHNIPKTIWEDIIKIFEMFHLIVLLPSGKYYVPTMLHTPKSSKPQHIGLLKNNLVINYFQENKLNYNCIRRKYEFSPALPFGFIDKLIVKYLHYPGIIIHESTWVNDFYLYVKNKNDQLNYHILIQCISEKENDFMNKELMISLFYSINEENENNEYFSFLSHFIFQSPLDIITASVNSTATIENIFIYNENLNHPIEDEKNILFNFNDTNNEDFLTYFISLDIKYFNSNFHKCEYINKLGSKKFAHVYSGKMKFNLNKNSEVGVVFKELKFISFERLRNRINEIMMMKIIENPFTIKLHGICKPSMLLLESRNKIYAEDHDNDDSYHDHIIDPNNFNENEYLHHQIIMIIEEAPWGDFTSCKEEILTIKLKLKIAFDVARGLNSLYSNNGVKLIHRDVKLENVFIFEVSENSISNIHSVHAKLGDFGNIVVASPSYSQRIGNYRYTAPEALCGSFSIPYSKEIDVYSFGILFWEILTGCIPFRELHENPETCDKIEKMIIDGYRPSLDKIPKDIPRCIIEIIKDCWNSKPNKRPKFEKIIAILTIILQLDIYDEQEIQNYLPFFEIVSQIKQNINYNHIDMKNFSNFKFEKSDPFGLVLICNFNFSDVIYNVKLNVLLSLLEDENNADHFNFICQNNVLPQHPNIIFLLPSFQCVLSDEIINFVDESVLSICNNTRSSRKFQFYIVEFI